MIVPVFPFLSEVGKGEVMSFSEGLIPYLFAGALIRVLYI